MAEESLKHKRLVRGIAKGAGVVFIATIIARILGYIIRAAIARKYGPEGYGLISTSLALFTIASTIAILGFTNSLTRQISFYLNTDRQNKIKSLIYSAYSISTVIAIIAGIAIYAFSELLAVRTFSNPQLTIFFKYFAAGLIFFVWIKLAASIFKAFKRMIWYTLIQDVLRFAAIFIAVVFVILLNKPVEALGFAYFIAFVVVGVLGTLGAFNLPLIKKYSAKEFLEEAGSLFGFSWPLMLASIIHMFLFRIDILMIGYFMDQSNVGIYNAAVPIGQLLTIIISSFTPFLLPTMTEQFANNDINNLKNTFSISTKWIFLLTIPLFALMFFFPDFFLVLIFGKQFSEASQVLQIISIGFLLAASVGPTGNLLIVMGKTKLHLLNNFIILVINFILNVVLIPQIGINGAAIASGVSFTLLNILALTEIYLISGIHPFSPVFFKITGVALGLAAAVKFVISPDNLLFGIIIFLVYGILYFLILRFIRSFDKDDRIIFREFEKKYNHSLDSIKKYLNI